jgi:nitroreductase
MPQANPAALEFLATRQSYPAKMMAAPAPVAATLRPILAAALRVPDHGGLQPWRLIIAERPALMRIADHAEARARALALEPDMIAKARGQFDRSPLAVIVVSAPVASAKVPQIEQVYSAGALCLGLLNAARASGWAASWITGWVAHDRAFVEQAFGLTRDESVAGIIHMGSETQPATDRARPDPDAVTTWLRG